MAMASHFLDTETRHQIPATALSCVEAGLTVLEARKVWRYEVSRAVWFNLWDVAGEWACWDRDWLVERTQRLRQRWDNRPGTARWLRYRLRVHLLHGCGVSIERFMVYLLRRDDPVERVRLTAALSLLALHYFDCADEAFTTLSADETASVGALYASCFRPAIRPACDRGEHPAGDARVRAALACLD